MEQGLSIVWFPRWFSSLSVEDGDVSIGLEQSSFSPFVQQVFRPVFRLWNSPSIQHKVVLVMLSPCQRFGQETCAVLAAIIESVDATEGRDKPTAYWAALV